MPATDYDIVAGLKHGYPVFTALFPNADSGLVAMTMLLAISYTTTVTVIGQKHPVLVANGRFPSHGPMKILPYPKKVCRVVRAPVDALNRYKFITGNPEEFVGICGRPPYIS